MRESVALLAVLVACATILFAQEKNTQPATAQQTETLKVCTLKVSGMTCDGCAAAVKRAAKKVAGVTDADVSYEKGRAVVTYDPAKTDPEAIAKAVTKKSGFKLEVTKPNKER
jgi:copper chaperone CopZ